MTPLNHSVLSPFIFVVEFKFMSYLNDSTMKRRILFYCDVCGHRRKHLCAGPGPCGYQRGNQPHDLVFRSRHQTMLCHRCGAWSGRRYQAYGKFSSGDPDTSKTRRQLVLCLYLSDRSRHHLTFLLPLKPMEYPVNKGAGNPVEFKGLKSQYLFVFAGGLAMVLLMVVFLYLTGWTNGYAYPSESCPAACWCG